MAITGVGVVSALGLTARDTWAGLVDGRVGIGPLTLFDTTGYRTRLAAQIPPFDPGDRLDPRDLRRASRGDVIGWLAAEAAVRDAGLEPGGPGSARLDPARAAVLIGGGGGGLLQVEDHVAATAAGRPAPRPSSLLGFFGAVTAGRIASRLGWRGPVNTLENACSSATVAISWAAMLVARGAQEVALAGGVETLSRTTYAGFNALRLVDERPCRPFDRDRRGLSLGECAAFLVLEPLEAARARGIRPCAEVAGAGMSADAHHMTAPQPDGEGLARAMRAALRSAGVTPDEVDHVNAHGTGTEQNDRAEARAIREVFGARAARLPVASIKGMVGHCLGAAGAIEAVAAARSLRDGLIPPTAGLADPDPDCDLDLVRGGARRADLRVVVSNSSAFGGNNAVLVLRKAEA